MILFFDIDGTLFGEYGVPESTVRALQRARENGHLRYLCTGRTYAMIPKKVLALDFDGIVAGGGTYIRIGEKILLDRELTKEEVEQSLSWLSHEGFGFLYEGRDCVHVMPWEYYEESERYRKHVEGIGAPYEVIDMEHPEQIHTAKFSGTILPHQWEYCRKMAEALSDKFDMITHKAPELAGSSRAATEGFVEFLPKGYHKAVGIERVLEHLGMTLAETYAFGDSNNDLEMLKLVPHSICMGNGTADARAAAEYITSDLNEDGIWRALVHYGLIEE